MMRFQLLSLVALVAADIAATTDAPAESHVLVLDDATLPEAIQTHSFLLVEFFAPWCGHCKALAPEFDAAATALNQAGSQVRLAAVDATVNPKSAKEYNVGGYPTLMFFASGVEREYSGPHLAPYIALCNTRHAPCPHFVSLGGRHAESIVEWAQKREAPSIVELTTLEQMKSFVARGLGASSAEPQKENEEETAAEHDWKFVVVAFLPEPADSGRGLRSVLERAGRQGDMTIGLVTSAEVAAHYDAAPPSLLAFSGDGQPADQIGLGGLAGELAAAGGVSDGEVMRTAEDAADKAVALFIARNAYPLVSKFDEVSGDLFASPIHDLLFLFGDDADEATLAGTEVLRQVAARYKGKLHAVTADIKMEEGKSVFDFFDVHAGTTPHLRMVQVDPAQETILKFLPAFKEVTVASATDFVEGFLRGEVSPSLKSQELPVDWDARPVKVLVGSNHEAVASDPGKAVFVKYYAPWCEHCKAIAPIWEQMAVELQDHSDLMLAKQDATANELRGLVIDSFPSFILYPLGGGPGIPFTQDASRETLLDFLAAQLGTADRPANSVWVRRLKRRSAKERFRLAGGAFLDQPSAALRDELMPLMETLIELELALEGGSKAGDEQNKDEL